MTSDQLITVLFGILGVIFIYWYFFGKKESQAVASGSSIDIKVDAGYSPSTIILKKNQPYTFNITRTDPSDCLEEIILPEFKIKKYLPLNKEVNLNIETKESGEYPFHCGMNMFHGKIIVKD